MSGVKIIQIGCGYWGPNLLRAFYRVKNCELVAAVDFSEERRSYLAKEFPYLFATKEYVQFLQDPSIDACVIATPAQNHFPLVKECLENGKDVFVEKPLAMCLKEAQQLVELSREKEKILMVGHTFLYHPAVQKLKEITKNQLGEILYFYSQRLNLGRVRNDINAWWNLAPHDLSILLYLMDNKMPETISVQGVSFLQKEIEDVAFATLKWADGKAAHIHVSWLDPNKVRKFSVIGRKKMVVYDDMQAEKLTLYDKGIDVIDPKTLNEVFDQSRPIGWSYRNGDIYIPYVEMKEPLKVEAEHFVECVQNRSIPLTGPKHALDTVAILDAGQKSLLSEGSSMKIEDNIYCLAQ